MTTTREDLEAVLPPAEAEDNTPSDRAMAALRALVRAGRAESRARHALDFLAVGTPEFTSRTTSWQAAVMEQAKATDEFNAAEAADGALDL